MEQRLIDRFAFAHVCFEVQRKNAAGGFLGASADPLPGIVAAAVVDGDYGEFFFRVVAVEDAFQSEGDLAAFVVGRNDHGAFRQGFLRDRRNRFIAEIKKGLPCKIENVGNDHQKADEKDPHVDLIAEKNDVCRIARGDIDQDECQRYGQEREKTDSVLQLHFPRQAACSGKGSFDEFGRIVPGGIQIGFQTVGAPAEHFRCPPQGPEQEQKQYSISTITNHE